MTTITRSRTRRKKRAITFGRWSRGRAVFTILFFVLVGLSPQFENITISPSFIGIGEWGISCPLGVAQVLAASRTLAPTLLIGGLVGLVLIVFTGRAFCSWICPGRWTFNQGPTVDRKPWKYGKWVQRGIVGGLLGASFACHNPLFCTICPAGVACRGAIAAGTGGSILPSVGWMTSLVGLEWATGRSFCRYLCPLGAVITWVSKFNPFLKPQANPATCVPCTACQKVCPMDLNLSTDTDLSACTKCFACHEACPRGAVTINLID